MLMRSSADKYPMMSNWKGAKFQTLCGRTFDSSTSLAEFLGVTVGAISHATSEAKGKGRMFFECGKPMKRFIRIIERNIADSYSQSEAPKQQFRVQTPDSDHNINLHDVDQEANTVLQDEFSSLCDLEFAICPNALPLTMKAMQVHAHMQAAAVKLFPDRKLILADPSSNPAKRDIDVSIIKRVSGTFSERLTRFDLAETWMLHSPGSVQSVIEFIRKLEGDSYYGLTTELSNRKYPSLIIGTYSNADKNKQIPVLGNKRPFMGAEDIVQFLLSDFTRTLHSPHNFLFEDETTVENNTYRAPMTSALAPPPTYDQSMGRQYCHPVQTTSSKMLSQQSQKQSEQQSEQNCSAEDQFMVTCSNMMKEVEESLQERRFLLGLADCDENNTKKRKRALAADSIRNVTTILFAANKLLYSDSQLSK